jgi:acyl-CoA synthetase (AMP-forming)/AMP-acid ligase II
LIEITGQYEKPWPGEEIYKTEANMTEKLILKELCRYHIGTYADMIYRNALLYPDYEAFSYKEEKVTFRQFNERVNSLIHALWANGAKQGDVLGILSWNCLEYVDVYGAAMKGGFIASPFNPRLEADELEYLINYSEAKTIFVGPELVEKVNALRSRIPNVKNYVSFEHFDADMISHEYLLQAYSKEEPDIKVAEEDPFLIFYTSGTTGVPRGALYTQGRKMADTRIFVHELAPDPGDKHIMIVPLFHVAGGSILWAFFFAAGGNVIMSQRSFDPAATLRAIEKEKATAIHIVSTHLVAMLSLPGLDTYDLSSLKRIWYAGATMPTELLRKGMEIFGPIFMQAYGQSESGPMITFLPARDHQVLERPPDEQQALGSIGQPCIGVHVRIVDEKSRDVKPGTVGEIVARSKSIMLEYWRKPNETRDVLVDGWLHTGDMGYYDENGFIYLVDRKKDMIISGGENIYPREVEEILYQHPAVKEAAVIGIPDPYWVEKVHAVVVLKSGKEANEKELIDFCKERLARFKAPKSVAFADSLPKNPQGKVLKRELRKKY